MNKVRAYLGKLDQWADTVIVPHWKNVRKILPFIAFTTIGLLVVTSIVRIVQHRDETVALLAQGHMQQIMQALVAIEKDCGIASVDHPRNYVDFLHVKSFVGSEIGGLNLKNAKKWSGPYIDDNPTLQGKVYEIVHAQEGFFLLPGQGVRLANGLIVGVDIIITPQTSIAKMTQLGGALNHRGKPLAYPLPFIKVQPPQFQVPVRSSDNFNQALEELNTALPYASNSVLENNASMSKVILSKISLLGGN